MVDKLNAMPGHILLPAPNGMYSKSTPLKSIDVLRNLLGLKLSASSINNDPCFSWDIVLIYLAHLSLLSLGANNGAGGCSLNVSLMTDFKYTNWCSCLFFFPKAASAVIPHVIEIIISVRLTTDPSLADIDLTSFETSSSLMCLNDSTRFVFNSSTTHTYLFELPPMFSVCGEGNKKVWSITKREVMCFHNLFRHFC
ncbi:cytochrome P450 71D10 [Trifolium repens]|nr:cytochrome P450 71D10 [Trifolium repens]